MHQIRIKLAAALAALLCLTPLHASAASLGDLNNDQKADASDAAQLLTAAAKIGAGDTSIQTAALTAVADVNTDGKVNASDAALILQYAANAGAGFGGSLTGYLAGVDEMTVYKPILDMFYQNISKKWAGVTESDGFDAGGFDYFNNCLGSYEWVTNTAYDSTGPACSLYTTWYQLADVTADGMLELLVGTLSAYDSTPILYDVYTVYQGKAVHLASTGKRETIFITEDGLIGDSGSSGAASGATDFYRFEAGKLVPVELYEYNFWADEAHPYTYADEFRLVTDTTLGSTYYYYEPLNTKYITEAQYNAFGNHGDMTFTPTLFALYK